VRRRGREGQILLDQCEPLADVPPVDCVLAYPTDCPDTVAYDALGTARERRRVRLAAVTQKMVGATLLCVS
jgi:hypothetical protein